MGSMGCSSSGVSAMVGSMGESSSEVSTIVKSDRVAMLSDGEWVTGGVAVSRAVTDPSG